MTEFEAEASPVTKVARDLTEILSLYESLRAQATATANHALMPGGPAMAALGNVANLEAWGHMQQATERYESGVEGYRKAYTSAEDEDPEEAWSPFQLLEFWSEDWRRVHEAEYEQRTTIASEAGFLRWALNWAWDNEPRWDDFAKDVRAARVRLENILYAGRRQERSRIVCPDCDPEVRLLVLRGSDADGGDDLWKCRRCTRRLLGDDVRKAHAKMLRSQGAERWLHQADALGLLKAQGRPERTVRQWLADGEGAGYCDPATHEVWVWWPDLWRRHLSTPQRQRTA
jgi:hypothetical protein